MLKAFLHRKLGRAKIDDQGDPEAQTLVFEGITSLEDPLTSGVFERLAYLEPSVAWELLRSACTRIDGLPLPEGPPAGAPTWTFWPKLKPGESGKNASY